MAKVNQYAFVGKVSEISEPKFLQNGAEVQCIVLDWMDGEYPQTAAFDFYAKNGLEKLHKLEIKVGDTVSIPASPASKVNEGTGANGPWRFWKTNMRGDSWNVQKLEAEAPKEVIPF